MEKEIIQIRQLPTAKEDIAIFAKKIEDYLDSGEVKASDIALRLKGFEKVSELIKKKLTSLVVDEISKFPKGEAEMNGATFKVSELGHKYDYSVCGDTVWQKLKEDVEKATEALKQRETFLKAIKDHETCINESTGEIVTLYPPAHSSTTGITISIK